MAQALMDRLKNGLAVYICQKHGNMQKNEMLK